MDIADSALTAFLRMLADLPDPDTVAAAIAHGALGLFRPVVVAIGFVHLERQALATEGLFGVSPEIRQLYADVPLETDIPATVCYRTNAVVTASSERLAVDFPLAASYASSSQTRGEFAAFPIRLRGAVIVVLGLEFPAPLAEPWYLRSAVSTISGPLALWAALRMTRDDFPDPFRPVRPDRPLTITERQQRIIALVRQGRTNPQIAAEIGFSVPTIKSELARLSTLLGANGRSDLAAKARRAGY